ncbi:hypothetical protein [Anaeromyxobacter sp. Fw109-5]|uniref:hypothetical protein n=1 Tax=Anaeromyxobacter sp. (strain Fw109-5) TaxID=404589 RepID=UPI00059BED2C|nr:hypothetical protein [Anaeromyxobacter sp. Fw109-5]
MTDLPQHAAQISIWMHLDDPSYGFAKEYELNWFTPYLVGYALARCLAEFTGVLNAIKLVVTAAVLAIPLSMHVLLGRTGGDRYWALLGFPAAFGFAFYWGFLNFLVAVPLGILFVALAYEYASFPTRSLGIAVGASAVLLFFAHALVFGICGATAAGMIALRARGLHGFVRRAVPLAAALMVALCWAAWTHSREPQSNWPHAWGVDLHRLFQFPMLVLGPRPPIRLSVSWLEVAALLLMLAAVVATRPRLSRDPARWVPGVAALAVVQLGPTRVADIALVAERFAMFLVPFCLFAVNGAANPRRSRWGHAALVALVVGWMVVLTARFHAFDEEAAGIDDLLARMEPRRNVLGLMFSGASAAVPAAPHQHMAAWYQAEKGGAFGYSFASCYPELARHAPTASRPIATEALALQPDSFNWERDGWYDYFIVRSPTDMGRSLFHDATKPVRLEARSGMWWLYRVDSSR